MLAALKTSSVVYTCWLSKSGHFVVVQRCSVDHAFLRLALLLFGFVAGEVARVTGDASLSGSE